MSREQAKYLAPFITAYANGEDIEFRYIGTTTWSTPDSLDLVMVAECRIKPKKHKVWMNIHQGASSHRFYVYATKSGADESIINRLACIEVEYAEGEGL